MKKAAWSALLLISVFLLCSCNGRVNSNARDEMEVINENLRLKDKVAELEKQIEEQAERNQCERNIQRVVNEFFYNINLGNVEEAEEKTTDKIKVNRYSVSLPNNRNIQVGKNEYLTLQLVDSEWNESDNVCLTFDQYYNEKNIKINVYMVKQDDDWKVDNMSLDYGV